MRKPVSASVAYVSRKDASGTMLIHSEFITVVCDDGTVWISREGKGFIAVNLSTIPNVSVS